MSRRRHTIAATLNKDVFGSIISENKASFTNIQVSGKEQAEVEELSFENKIGSDHFL